MNNGENVHSHQPLAFDNRVISTLTGFLLDPLVDCASEWKNCGDYQKVYDGSERLFGRALTLDIGATYEPAASRLREGLAKTIRRASDLVMRARSFDMPQACESTGSWMVANYILRLRQSIGGCLEDRTERCRRCLGRMQEGEGEYKYHKQNRAYEKTNFSR